MSWSALFEQVLSAPVGQALSHDEGQQLEACTKSRPCVLSLARHVSLVSAMRIDEGGLRALIDVSALPPTRLNDGDEVSAMLTHLGHVLTDALRAARVEDKTYRFRGASCVFALKAKSVARAQKLASAWPSRPVGTRFANPVADAWLSLAADALLDWGEPQQVLDWRRRLLLLEHERLFVVRLVAEAFVQAGQATQGASELGFSMPTLESWRPSRLPPFEDGRHEWFRDAPIRAWACTLVALARLRRAAGDEVGFAELHGIALGVLGADAERPLR